MASNVVVFADGEDKDIFSVYVAAVEKKVSNHWRACQEMADKEAAAKNLPFFSRRAAMKAIRKQYSRVPTCRTRFSCIADLLPQQKERFFNYLLSYDPYYLYAVKADKSSDRSLCCCLCGRMCRRKAYMVASVTFVLRGSNER